ncbi:spermidine/putrescine transport system permease protein [Natronorubrum sediminis]|uniref:Spermidine/putrescine transport system permease protein n=1 Tax=Natronorubrum sediminis TaxID=640943 RepID=A0A1H6FZ39_9EURY|nr:ABC transporter permease [Natronorubrum sediminis]SEH14975.1 spermidine/putrescine transport system permease protein [Natronorubrum sediminis]
MRTIRLDSVSLPPALRKRVSARTLVGLGLVWLTVFFIVPVLYLLVESLNFGDGGLFTYYETALSGVYGETLVRTFLYAFLTTAICLVLGYLSAYYIAFKSKRAILLLSLVLLPLWIAIIIRFFGVRLFFISSGPVQQVFGTDFGFLFSRNGVILGLVCALLPFAVLPIYNSLRSIDDELINASHTLGASQLQTLRTVILPLSYPGIIAATLFVFILAAGSYLAPSFLGSSENLMMANRIADAQGYSVALASAMSVVFTGGLLILVGLFNHFANVSEVLGDL